MSEVSPHFRIEGYGGFEIPQGMGVIYEYYIPSIGLSYVGQTIDLLRRHEAHKRRGRLAPYIASNDYVLNILEIVECSRLDREERRFIAQLNTRTPFGLNVSEGGRDLDIAPLTDFASRMRWTFEDHDVPVCGEAFKAKVFKGKSGGFFIRIPKKAADSLLLIEGDELDCEMSHRRQS